MAKSPEEQKQSMIDNLPEKTGKPLADWLKILGKAGLEKHGERVGYLKSDHGMTHGFANLVAHEFKAASEGGSSAAAVDPVAQQYDGGKAGLKPIYDKLTQEIMKFGKDVELAPKKAYVSIRRNKQFAIIQPSTKTRVDLGLNLKDKAPSGRLEASGSFNAMVSHRVKLSSVNDVDKDVICWLKEAYQGA